MSKKREPPRAENNFETCHLRTLGRMRIAKGQRAIAVQTESTVDMATRYMILLSSQKCWYQRPSYNLPKNKCPRLLSHMVSSSIEPYSRYHSCRFFVITLHAFDQTSVSTFPALPFPLHATPTLIPSPDFSSLPLPDGG
jgi:hypothetical protein